MTEVNHRSLINEQSANEKKLSKRLIWSLANVVTSRQYQFM